MSWGAIHTTTRAHGSYAIHNWPTSFLLDGSEKFKTTEIPDVDRIPIKWQKRKTPEQAMDTNLTNDAPKNVVQ